MNSDTSSKKAKAVPSPPQGDLKTSPPEGWVDKYGDYLYRCAILRARDPQLAEDLVQETFLAALKSKASFSGRSSEKTWLVGILKHKVIDHFRKNAKESVVDNIENTPDANEHMFTLGFWSPFNRPGRWEGSPPEAAENTAFWGVFLECLKGLPERVARAFYLREVDDLSSPEICKELDVTSTNLWVMLHRARARLRRCIELKWLDGEWKGKRQ